MDRFIKNLSQRTCFRKYQKASSYNSQVILYDFELQFIFYYLTESKVTVTKSLVASARILTLLPESFLNFKS